MVRLRAVVSRERRIEVPTLHLANQAEDHPIPWVGDSLQGGGQVEQEERHGLPQLTGELPRRQR
jgi:hypothetical protein